MAGIALVIANVLNKVYVSIEKSAKKSILIKYLFFNTSTVVFNSNNNNIRTKATREKVKLNLIVSYLVYLFAKL